MIKTKTSNEIADELHKVVRDISEPSTYLDRCIRIRDKKYVTVDGIDLYRELINEYGKAEIWGLNVDEVCEKIEEMIKK